MTRSIFRGLVLGMWGLTFLCVVVSLATRRYLPPELLNYLDSIGSREQTTFDWVILALSLFLSLLLIIASVGLYKFKRWGRTLFLWVNLASLAILPSSGASVESGFS